jgi:ATP-binding cassette subfamily B protein
VLSYLTVVVGQAVVHELRLTLFDSLYRLPLRRFASSRAGDLQSRLNNDINGVLFFLTSISSTTITAITTIVGVVAAMFLLSWQLALASLIVVPAFAVSSHVAGTKKRAATVRRQLAYSDLSGMSQESLSPSAVQQARLFGRVRAQQEQFRRKSQAVARTGVDQWMMGNIETNASSTLFALMPVLAFATVALLAGPNGVPGVSVGTLAAFIALQTRLYWPLTNMLQLVVNAKASGAYFERIFEFADTAADPTLTGSTPGPRVPRGNVQVSSLSFSYSDSPGEPTLQDVTFKAESGELVAVVGPSGSGKSTLAQLIAGLYQPSAGAVLIDGWEISEIDPFKRPSLVGLVTQDVFLFHETVRSNLLFAKPHASAHELEVAARAAGIHDRIARLPSGYDTLVGEGGLALSVGERQRLSLARVLLRDPAVVILDEFTSALDAENEDLLIDAMHELLRRDKTVLMISHRPRALDRADTIVVLENGVICETGSHDELLARQGRYVALQRASVTAGSEPTPQLLEVSG